MKRVLGFLIYSMIWIAIAHPLITGLQVKPGTGDWFIYWMFASAIIAGAITANVIDNWVWKVLKGK